MLLQDLFEEGQRQIGGLARWKALQ
jgi:hypothetical protein